MMLRKILVSLAMMSVGVSFAATPDISSKTVTIDHHPYHYYQVGHKGSPYVLLTGYATTSNFWNKDFVTCLAENHQVYLFDYQGINSSESSVDNISIASMAKDVNKFVQQLKLRKPVLVGWSMGGGVALQAASAEPKLYKQLELFSSIVPSSESNLLFPIAPHGEFKSQQDVLNYVFSNNLYGYESANESQLQTQFINGVNVALFPNLPIIEKQGTAIYQWVSDTKNLTILEHEHTPATFYVPSNDAIINQAIAKRSIAKDRSAKIVEVANSGHGVSWQYPQQMCQAIVQ